MAETQEPRGGFVGDAVGKVMEKGFDLIEIGFDQLKFAHSRIDKADDTVISEFETWLNQGKSLLRRLVKAVPV